MGAGSGTSSHFKAGGAGADGPSRSPRLFERVWPLTPASPMAPTVLAFKCRAGFTSMPSVKRISITSPLPRRHSPIMGLGRKKAHYSQEVFSRSGSKVKAGVTLRSLWPPPHLHPSHQRQGWDLACSTARCPRRALPPTDLLHYVSVMKASAQQVALFIASQRMRAGMRRERYLSNHWGRGWWLNGGRRDGGMAARLAGLRGRQKVVQSGARSKAAVITWSERINLTAYWCFFVFFYHPYCDYFWAPHQERHSQFFSLSRDLRLSSGLKCCCKGKRQD